jgi:membrane-associated protease RseP (regulator of RpoE activity)
MNAQAALRGCTAVLMGAGLALWLTAAPCFGQVAFQNGSGGATAAASGGLGVTLGMAGGHVVVTGVAQQGALAGLGLRPGDVIAGVNGQGVFSAADVMSRLSAAASGGTGNNALGASLAVARGGQQRILNLPPSALNGLLKAQANASATAQATAPPFASIEASGEAAANENAAAGRPNAAAQPTTGGSQTTAASNLMRDSLSRRSMTNGFGTPTGLPLGFVPTTLPTQATVSSTSNQAAITMPVPTPERPSVNASGAPASFGELPKAGAQNQSTSAAAIGTTTSTNVATASAPQATASAPQVVMPIPTPERPAVNASGEPASFGELPKAGVQSSSAAATATGTTTSPTVAAASVPQVVMPIPTPERPSVNASGAPASFGELPKSGAQISSTAQPAVATAVLTPSGPRLVMPVPTPERPAVNASGGAASFGQLPKAGPAVFVRPGAGFARPAGGGARAGGGTRAGGGGAARGGGGGGGVKAGGS